MTIRTQTCSTIVCNGCNETMGDLGEGIPHYEVGEVGESLRKEEISNYEWATVPRQPWVGERHYCLDCDPPDCDCGHEHIRRSSNIEKACEGGMEEVNCGCTRYIPVKPKV